MVGISFTASSLILFLFQIYLGRSLGPDGYGNFAYILTVGNFLSILYMIGLQQAIINIISPLTGNERKAHLTTILLLILLLFLGMSILFFFVQELIGTLFTIDPTLVRYSILYAFAFGLYSLIQASVQALQDMRSVSILRLVSCILFVVIFFALQSILPYAIDYRGVVGCKSAGLVSAIVVILLVSLRREISFRLFNLKASRVLFHYALYGFLLQVCAAFTLEFSKIVLNRYFDAATIGLYQVYFISSVSIAQMILVSIVTVYFPAISKSKNKARVIETLASYERFLPLLIVPSLLLSYTFFKMYGRQYPLNLLTLLIFNVYVIFYFVSSIYSRTLESFGVFGVRSSVVVNVAGTVITVVLSFLLIPVFGINGAIITMTVARIVLFVVLRILLKEKVTGSIRFDSDSSS